MDRQQRNRKRDIEPQRWTDSKRKMGGGTETKQEKGQWSRRTAEEHTRQTDTDKRRKEQLRRDSRGTREMDKDKRRQEKWRRDSRGTHETDTDKRRQEHWRRQTAEKQIDKRGQEQWRRQKKEEHMRQTKEGRNSGGDRQQKKQTDTDKRG